MEGLNISAFLLYVCFTFANGNPGRHNASDHMNIFSAGITIPDCKVTPMDKTLRTKLLTLLHEGKKLIFIQLSFDDHPNPVPEDYIGNVYKPLNWVRTYGRHGRSLLFLRPQFEHLSLTTLSFQTAHIHVTLKQTPTRCLTSQNISTIEENLRRLLVLDFKMNHEENDHLDNEKICNVHVKNDNSIVSFRYVCCQHDHDETEDHLLCKEMPMDYWMEMLFICVLLIKVLVIMFCPLFIPESFYRKKYTESVYEHTLSKPLEINVKKITAVENSDVMYKNIPVVSIEHLSKLQKNYEWNKVCKMSQFYEKLKNLPVNKVLKLTLRKLKIVVRYDRLVPANYVPVGILQIFYTMFVKCHIRKTKSFSPCCRSSIFSFGFKRKKENDKNQLQQNDGIVMSESKQSYDLKTEGGTKYQWYKFLRQTMRFLLFQSLLVPWIIRVYFYYAYEESEAFAQKRAAEVRRIKLPAFKWNLTYTLTPLHPMFLICYSIVFVDALVFGLVSPRIKKKLQSLMRKCLRDMRQVSKLEKFKGSFALLLVPCEVCGIFGCISAGVYLLFAGPIIVASLAFYCLPTVNLTLRLLAHFLAYLTLGFCRREDSIAFRKRCNFLLSLFQLDSISHQNVSKEKDESLTDKILQIFVLLACLLTVFSMVVLTMETIIFFVEMILYTVIGIIMNSDDMLKYITLVFMLAVYARDCFKGIGDKYLKFNKSINSLLVDMTRSKVEKVANEYFDDQQNTAFQISTENIYEESKQEENEIKLVLKDGSPKWSIPRLILFLDRQDQPYITEKFFFQSCYMDTVGVPGPLIPNIIHATWRFLCIFAFLMFVVLIVLAFGDEYNISGTNQMLATLAGGLLPWIFTSFLFTPSEPPELDVDNLSFKSNFKAIIDNYLQNWDIHDIDTNSDSEIVDIENEHASLTARLVDQETDSVISVVNHMSDGLQNTKKDDKNDYFEPALQLIVTEKPSKIVNV